MGRIHSQKDCVGSNSRNFVVFLVIVTTILITEVFTIKLLFQTVQDNVAIDGIKPFYNQNVDNKLKCYAICQRTLDKCLFVEVSKIYRADVWSCKLFEFTNGDIKDYLKPTSLDTTTTVSTPTLKRDCLDLLYNGFNKDGVYYIGFTGSPRKVYCDMTTEGGGWIVMQKRFDGSVDFYRDWNTFKNGFGNVHGEYWLGNEFVHQYTNSHYTEMLGEAIDFNGVRAAIVLKGFILGDEAVSNYTLHFDDCIVLTNGTENQICINWVWSKSMKFSTFDQDNDLNVDINCVEHFNGGAWWGRNCFQVNFNGRYSSMEDVDFAKNIHWRDFSTNYKSLMETKIMIRRRVQ